MLFSTYFYLRLGFNHQFLKLYMKRFIITKYITAMALTEDKRIKRQDGTTYLQLHTHQCSAQRHFLNYQLYCRKTWHPTPVLPMRVTNKNTTCKKEIYHIWDVYYKQLLRHLSWKVSFKTASFCLEDKWNKQNELISMKRPVSSTTVE